MAFYIYISLLLIMLVMMIQDLYLAKFSPKKIKIIAFFVIIVMILRYISLFILFLSHSIKYLYMLKVFFFLNLIAVPILALTVLCIFMRRDNTNFSYIFGIAVGLLAAYTFIMYKCTVILQNVDGFGYTMFFSKDIHIYWIYVVLNTLMIFFTVGLVSKNNVNKFGIYLIMISSIVTIIDVVTWTMGVNFIAENIIGDVFWVITLTYALSKVKKRV